MEDKNATEEAKDDNATPELPQQEETHVQDNPEEQGQQEPEQDEQEPKAGTQDTKQENYKSHVTNTEDIMNAAARGHAHIALLDNRNLMAAWDKNIELAAKMGLMPMTTHYINLLNYDTNFIRKKMDTGNIDITVYVSVPLIGPDAVMQVYMYTGMPFPVKPGFFC
jgi:hypothetical protein